MAKGKYTSLSVSKKTKKILDSLKHRGQTYNGLIHELVEFWKMEHGVGVDGTGRLKRIRNFFARRSR